MNLVGTSEAAAILDVEVPRITRWRKEGRMPPSAELAATHVWYREAIEHMRDNNGVASENGGPPEDVMGTAEVAKLLGVNKSQIGRWLRDRKKRLAEGKDPGPFPAERWRLNAGPVWRGQDIRSYHEARA